jgi:hypothetical protein
VGMFRLLLFRVLSSRLASNRIGRVYSLEYTDIPKVFFTSHHVGAIVSLISSKTFVAQQCVQTNTLGHSCSNVATRMVEAKGCPRLVAKTGQSWSVGKSPWSNNRLGQAPTKQVSWGRYGR